MKNTDLFQVVALCFAGFCFARCSVPKDEKINRDRITQILKDARARDQEPRLVIDSLMRKGITDGNLFLPAIIQQKEADSLNQKIVLPIIETLVKYKVYDLDTTAYETCWLVIQHADNDIMVKHIEFVEQLARRKIISPSSYMAFVDRLNINKNKAQIYGLQFRRLADGTMIQYPVLNGQKKKWEKLGLNFETNNFLPSEYSINYPAIRIKENQFAIIGFVLKGKSDWAIEDNSTIKNTEVFLNGQVAATTDVNGYFCIIMNKKSLPADVKILINNNQIEYNIAYSEDSDFFISNGYYFDGKLEVVKL